ncbi:MAG: hypothetical protein LAP87_15670 [Acidobacteriia bacterium]|nr:hypothetical protein [Terriglobia bacterium]
MKTLSRTYKAICRARHSRASNRFLTLILPLLVMALLLAPGAQAARPGGVAVLLPPFIPVLDPTVGLQAISPVNAIGFIQAATLDPVGTNGCAHPYCGGTVTVNGSTFIVPANTIFQFPATAMTWDDMFANAPAAYKALGQSGMALSDTPKPLTTYEISVFANRVITATSDQLIAGLLLPISQNIANMNQGMINFIDYARAEVWVGGPLNVKSGARLRINTPHGRYGIPDPLADPRFGSDEDNPTIVARTGYPVCVPRVAPPAQDALCPTWNRPVDPFTGAFAVNYTMPAAQPDAVPDANGVTHQLGYNAAIAAGPGATFTPPITPDPFEQVPLEVGDYVTFAGTLTQDVPCVAGQPVSSCQYISTHTLTVELGIYTAPSTWPVYSFMSEFRIAIGGIPNPIFPAESQEKVFGDFFTTDFSQLVDVYAVDVDPCTGARTHRYYGSSDPFGPPLGGLKGRARFRQVIGNFIPGTREMAVASRSMTGGAPLDTVLPTAKVIANGLVAGTFQAPQFEFILPENLILGSPQIPFPFEELPFLLNGSGPYQRFADGFISPPPPLIPPPGVAGVPGGLGQIKPWPNLNAPSATCTVAMTSINPPVANAGPTQSVGSGALVTLDGSASSDPNVPAMTLIYTWQQFNGPAVTLDNPSLAKPRFTAPTLAVGAPPVILSFQLAVCNGYTCGGVATVNITVTAAAAAASVTLSTSAPNVLLNTPVTLTAVVTPAGVAQFRQIAGPAQPLAVNGNTATFTPTAVTIPGGVNPPVQLTFTATVGTSVATVNVFVGADTITVTNVVYALSKSRLQVAFSTNAPLFPNMGQGGPVTMLVQPLDFAGNPQGPSLVPIYDPTLNTYNLLALIINPIPSAVRITSSGGGSIVAGITRIR